MITAFDSGDQGGGYIVPPEYVDVLLYFNVTGISPHYKVPKRGSRAAIQRKRGNSGWLYFQTYDFLKWRKENRNA